MARVIVCAGEQSSRPLVVSASNRKLYSAEEVCYYIYHNAEMAEDLFADKSLADFYEFELKLEETAKRLRLLDAADAQAKEYALLLFGVTPMYTEEEIKEYLQELEKFSGLQEWQKQKAKADMYLDHGNYRDASAIYEKLLRSREKNEMSDAIAGNIYHNLAVCELHTTGPGVAGVHFAAAYEKNRNTDSLRSYLLALRLSKKDDEYLQVPDRFPVPESMRSEVDTMLLGTVIEAGETSEYQRLMRVKKMLLEGQIKEYRQATRVLLEEFKKQYRLDNM